MVKLALTYETVPLILLCIRVNVLSKRHHEKERIKEETENGARYNRIDEEPKKFSQTRGADLFGVADLTPVGNQAATEKTIVDR